LTSPNQRPAIATSSSCPPTGRVRRTGDSLFRMFCRSVQLPSLAIFHQSRGSGNNCQLSSPEP
jgi:hypothetical protein